MSLTTVLVLILSGVMVGFINSLSAGGTAISIALYLSLGLSPAVANATNRIGVLFQTGTTTLLLYRKKQVPWRAVCVYGIPTIIGAVIGSKTSSIINEQIFAWVLGVVLLTMIVFISLPARKLKADDEQKINKGITIGKALVFLLTGFYGGFVQVGSGFLLILAGMAGLGYGLMTSNGLKVAVMFFYTIAALITFSVNVEINWQYGILHSMGNMLGAWVATCLAIKQGVGFVRWVIIIVILFTAGILFGWIDLNDFFDTLKTK